MNDVLDDLRAAADYQIRMSGSASDYLLEAENEIKRLRAEVERQARHIEELREKIDADRSCACSFDAPGDVCAAHSPALMQARAEVERLRGDMPVAESLRVNAKCAEIERDEARAAVWKQAKEIADLRAEVKQLIRERDEARAYIEARRREAKP